MNHEVKSVVIVDRDNLTKKPAATTSIAGAMRRQQSLYPSLEEVTRPNLKTEEAAHYLNRRPQTLRAWACLENGPLRPKRIHGILAWSTNEVKALAGVQA